MDLVIGLGVTFRRRLNDAVGISVLSVMAMRAAFATKRMPQLIRSRTAQQIVFTGVDALGLVGMLALGIGTLVTFQASRFNPNLSGDPTFVRTLILILLEEVGPLLTAFVVIARSGTAMAVEIGYMRVLGEIDALEGMGIDPIRLLILPRVVGVAVSVVALTVYFGIISLGGGVLFAPIFDSSADLSLLLHNLLLAVSLSSLFGSLLKACLFGVTIPLVCCFFGFQSRHSFTEVPPMTIRAVVTAMSICFVLNIFLSVALA